MAAHPEPLPIFLLLLSVLLFPKRPRTALLLFGVSLALKQIAVFAAPLYLIWVWHDSKANLRRVLSAASWRSPRSRFFYRSRFSSGTPRLT